MAEGKVNHKRTKRRIDKGANGESQKEGGGLGGRSNEQNRGGGRSIAKA